jgi:hypothetical protein
MGYARKGMGGPVWDVFMSSIPGTKQFCDDPASLLSPFQAMCLPYDVNKKATNIISPTVAPPQPKPPTFTFVTAATPGAIYAGLDASGNAVYLLPQNAQDNAAMNAEAARQFFARYSDANPPTDCTTFWNSLFNPVCSGDGSTPVDCTTFYNSNFNSACGGSLLSLAVLAGVAIFGLTMMVKR